MPVTSAILGCDPFRVEDDLKLVDVYIQQGYQYSRIPLIRKLVIQIADYPERLGPSCKYFRTVTVVRIFVAQIFPPIVKYIQAIKY